MHSQADDFPIQLVSDHALPRARITVFFRWLLAIPHIIYLFLWGIAVFFCIFVGWFIALFTGRLPEGMHDFAARYLRYETRVNAYTSLLADPYPPFGTSGEYPVELVVAPPEKQRRWTVLLRIFLVLPWAFVIGLLGGFNILWASGGRGTKISLSPYDLYIFAAWLACLFTGRMPMTFQRFGEWYLRVSMEISAYMCLLTDRHPRLSPD